ncbi:MAG: chemotaxis protein CheA [archaeon]|nr:chemotaxis protein CheA [archaeon]
MSMEKYKELFLEETKDRLNALDDFILKLEENPKDLSILHEIFRVAHTLKGMAAAMGFQDIASLTHKMEDILDILREGKAKVTDDITSVLLDCRDALFSRVDEIEADIEYSQDFEEIANFLDNIINELLNEDNTSEEKTEEIVINNLSIETSIESDDNRTNKEELKARNNLEIYHPAPGFFSDKESDKFRQESLKGKIIVKFLIKILPDCEMKYVRAFMAIKKVKTYGEILKIFPDEKVIKSEVFGNDIEIFLIFDNLTNLDIIIEDLSSIAEVTEITTKKTEIITKKEEEEKKKEAAGFKKKSSAITKEKDLSIQHIKVSIKSLDNLYNYIGELLISKIRLDKIDQKYEIKELKESLTNINHVVFDLQDEVMKMRMISVSHVFDKFPRMVRDLAKKMNKNINFIMEGRDIELDRTILDQIGDPLIHLLRNSVDHGMETSEEREQEGKPRSGEVKLMAYRDRNYVVIEVSDDGRGIDFEKFRDKAVAKGVITVKESQNMSINDLKKLLLRGGISTNSEITEVSGRGVGMGVVKQKIESMGGIIEIHSEYGKGSRFIIKLPLTVAIIQSLLVSIGKDQSEEIYAIPINNIVRSLIINKDQIKSINNKDVIYMLDRIIPLIDLRKIVLYGENWQNEAINTEVNKLELDDDAVGIEKIVEKRTREVKVQKKEDLMTIVIVESGDAEFGLVVDKLIGQQEIVIKNLGRLLKNAKGISGGTILGDGKVAIILDVATML